MKEDITLQYCQAWKWFKQFAQLTIIVDIITVIVSRVL